jgi:hypothetical protein
MHHLVLGIVDGSQVSLSPGNLRQYLGRGDALIISVNLSPGNHRQYLGRGDALIISVNLSTGEGSQGSN